MNPTWGIPPILMVPNDGGMKNLSLGYRQTIWLGVGCLLWALLAPAVARGIQFFTGPWEAALATARAQQRPVFVAALTPNCACAALEAEVFTHPEVADFFQANFINVRMDMDTGVGPALAQQWEVTYFPSLVFTDATGQLLHLYVGETDAAGLLDLAEKALDPQQNLAGMAARFAAGERQANFLYAYAIAAGLALRAEAPAIAEAYLATQQNWLTPENQEVVFNFFADSHSPLFAFMLANLPSFEARFGPEEVRQRLTLIIESEIEANQHPPDAAFQRLEQLYRQVQPTQAPERLAYLKMSYYRERGDGNAFARAAILYLREKIDPSPDELNNLAWDFVTLVDDPALLREALRWAERAVSQFRQPYNLDTLAWLHYKLGERRMAKKIAQEAWQLAKQMGEPVAETQQLLDLLKH